MALPLRNAAATCRGTAPSRSGTETKYTKAGFPIIKKSPRPPQFYANGAQCSNRSPEGLGLVAMVAKRALTRILSPRIAVIGMSPVKAEDAGRGLTTRGPRRHSQALPGPCVVPPPWGRELALGREPGNSTQSGSLGGRSSSLCVSFRGGCRYPDIGASAGHKARG